MFYDTRWIIVEDKFWNSNPNLLTTKCLTQRNRKWCPFLAWSSNWCREERSGVTCHTLGSKNDVICPAYVGWVCCGFLPLLREILSSYSGFLLSSKTKLSQFQFDLESVLITVDISIGWFTQSRVGLHTQRGRNWNHFWDLSTVHRLTRRMDAYFSTRLMAVRGTVGLSQWLIFKETKGFK